MRKPFLILLIIMTATGAVTGEQILSYAGGSDQVEAFTRAIKELQRKVQDNDRAVTLLDARIAEINHLRDEAGMQHRETGALDSEIDRLQRERSFRIDAANRWKVELQSVTE